MFKYSTLKAAPPLPFQELFRKRKNIPNLDDAWWFNDTLQWWTLEHWEGPLWLADRRCGDMRVFACNPFGKSHPEYRPLHAFDDELATPNDFDVAVLLGTFTLEMTIHLAGKRTYVFAFGDRPHQLATDTLQRFNATNMGTVNRQSCGLRAPELIEKLPKNDPCTRRRPWLDRYLTQGPSYLTSVAQLPWARSMMPSFRRLELERRPSGLDMK